MSLATRVRPVLRDGVLLAHLARGARVDIPRLVTLGPGGRAEVDKAGDELVPVASTLKVVTALVVRQHVPDRRLDEVVQIAEVGSQGRGVLGLRVGDLVRYRDLLAGMLLPSDNDAAHALALGVAGDLPAFLDLMGQYARTNGWHGAVFADTSGDDNDSRLATRHLAQAIALAVGDRELGPMLAAQAWPVTIFGPQARVLRARHTIPRRHRLLVRQFAGGKTGGTAVAGSCMVWHWRDRRGATRYSAFTGVKNAAWRTLAMRQVMADR